MRRFITGLLFVLIFSPAAARAQSQIPSIRDITELTKAGVADEVILALIEVHRPVYPVDLETLTALKAAGISPAVIVAMVKSGRTPAPVAAPVAAADPEPVQPPPPQVVVVEHERVREAPSVREVPVAVPVYVTVPSRSHGKPPKKSEPVYWGWGGKLRPDAWKPSVAAEFQKDARVPPPQKK